MNDLVRAWVDGWVLSRGAAPPIEEPWGWSVDVGQVEQVSRRVLGTIGDDIDEAVVRKVADSVTGYGVWLKVFADPALVRGWLGPEWWVDPNAGFLMSVPLTRDAPPAAPDGYRVRTWTHGPVTQALVTAPDGALAARGQIGVSGPTAVVDRVETAPTHRRKGLGGLVVRTLQATAAEQGAETGVLAGTPDGRALYEHLGWTTAALLTSAKFTA